MAASTTTSDAIKAIMDSIDKGIGDGVNSFLNGVYGQWLIIWAHWYPVIIIVSSLIIIGVVIQIIMIREGGPNNRLPSWFNSLVGHLLYVVIFFSSWLISFKIWGPNVIDEIWRVVFSGLAVSLTWLILHAIGFWPY